MNVTIVDADLSYPATSGKRLRTLNLMLSLADRHRIKYIGRIDAHGENSRQAVEYLADHGIEPILVEHRVPRKSGARFHGRLLLNLLSPLPYSVTSHRSHRIDRAVGQEAARRQTDVWQFEWLPYVQSLDRFSEQPALLSAQNVDSLIWQRYYETETVAWKRWFIRHQWRKLQRLEREMLPKYRSVIAVSDEDAEIFAKQLGVVDVTVVDNGIDPAQFRELKPEPESLRVLFLGLLDYRPNRDAVEQLLNHVFPSVLRQEPSARLWIVGRNPPDDMVSLIQRSRQVELCRDVPDIRPYLARSSVLAVPLRVGGGSRLKILEAVASGLPVVSTTIGAEGLALGAEHGVQVVPGIQEMADRIVQCLRRPQPFRDAADHGRAWVLERYAWNSLADRLESVWERAAKGRCST